MTPFTLSRTLLFASLYFFLHTATRAEWRETALPSTEQAGPRWYRGFVKVQDNMTVAQEKDLWRDSVMLHLGGIKGEVTVWLNGQKVIETADLPAEGRRRFKVPKGILQKGVYNSVVLKAAGPVPLAPILSGYFDEVRLEGAWEVSDAAPAEADFKPLAAAPARGGWNETMFHPSATPLAPTELMPGEKLSARESLARMTAGEGLELELISAEPDVAQPTHISFDEKGRMWVSQYRQYPLPAGLRMISRDKYYRSRYDKVPPAPPHQDKGRDIITVSEDTNGDGLYDRQKVVLDGLNMANSAVRGHGGIWVMNTPYLMFYPDRDGDDVPDADPEVRLAGFGLEDTHSVANGLVWGPDGWLYGGQGSTTTSRVIRPGLDAPEAGQYFEGCMVWRYHPEQKRYEIFAEGGGNVFGLDFDGEGRLFCGHNGGDTRGWHYVPAGLFLKQGVDVGKFGPSGNPFAFGNLDMMKSSHPIPRFSHMIVIAEGNALPASMQGRILGADPLHRNVVIAERYAKGSSFTTSDSGVALKSTDQSFRPVFLANAPDGAMYVADFYEEFIAHGQNYQGQIDPSTGRIFRLRGKGLPLNKDTDLSKLSAAQLVKVLRHPNRWHRQTAVRVLAERKDASVVETLKKLLDEKETHPALEALWTLHQLDALDATTSLKALAHPAAPVRAWSIRLAGEAGKLPADFATALVAKLKTESDAEVRSQAASTARRLDRNAGLQIVRALLNRDADADDPYIPLLCWWTIEAGCAQVPGGSRTGDVLTTIWSAADTQMVKKHILGRLMRRFASTGRNADLLVCATLLETAQTDELKRELMKGFEEAFKGRALPALPEPLVKALANVGGGLSPLLRVRLGDPAATQDAIKSMTDPKAKPDDRLLSARLFGEVKTPAAVPALLAIASEEKATNDLRKAALVSLLLYEDAAIGNAVATLYSKLPEDARPAAMNLLASRESWSRELLRLLTAGTVKPADFPADIAARLRLQPGLAEEVARLLPAAPVGGQAEKQAEIARVRNVLSTGAGDPYKGEATYLQRCAACHTLFFKGGQIGPNLTSYQRDDVGTLLPSLLDPSAEIREGFENYLVTMKDGRALSGLLMDKDLSIVVLRGLDGQNLTVPQAEVKEMKRFERSLMPDGLLTGLTEQEIRDFFSYLRMPQPITK